MGLISGILLGTLVGIALMAGWREMMRYRSMQRISKLKDLQVFTVIRVIFQLAEEIPCNSAVVVVALLSEDTVNTIVTDKLQWPHRIIIPIGGIPVDTSELELKPQGRLSVTVVKANALKNVEMIGKSDPYMVVYIQPIFKFKTKVADDNLNPVWNQTIFELIVEDKETQALVLEVFDKDITQDQRMGVAKLPLIELEPETPKEYELRLLPSDMLKVKDKKDRGTLTIKQEIAGANTLWLSGVGTFNFPHPGSSRLTYHYRPVARLECARQK